MAAVLPGRSWCNSLGPNPETDPPDAERREPARRCCRSERRTVVASDCRRQLVGSEIRVTAKNETAEIVDERQRIALPLVARLELAFEVGRPHIVRRNSVDERLGVACDPLSPLARWSPICTASVIRFRRDSAGKTQPQLGDFKCGAQALFDIAEIPQWNAATTRRLQCRGASVVRLRRGSRQRSACLGDSNVAAQASFDCRGASVWSRRERRSIAPRSA
jgi:hypothetical protein